MLQPILHQLKTQRIVLASGSPRRHEILRNIVNLHFFFLKKIFLPNFFVGTK